jgi:hypothetical protein
MFSKTITNSGKFLKMPASSRLLYYDLGMNADDDGYAEWFTVMRMSGSSEQDLQVLRANGLVEVFDDNVLVILDWLENNQIRLDRYQPSKYKDVYTGLPNGNQMATIGKPSIGKVSIGKDRVGKVTNTPEETSEINELIDLFKEVNPSFTKLFRVNPQREASKRLLKTHGMDRLKQIISFLPKSNQTEYMPVVTTPCQLEDKFGQLAAAWQKKKNNQPIVL